MRECDVRTPEQALAYKERIMISQHTKAVKHFDKWVPCCEGRVISHGDNPARLVRVESEAEAENISDQYREALYGGNSAPRGFKAGDSYMLSQNPVTNPN